MNEISQIKRKTISETFDLGVMLTTVLLETSLIFGKRLGMSPASSPGAVQKRSKKNKNKNKTGSAGLNGRGLCFFSITIPQLSRHRAQQSHNSMGTALKKGGTPGDEAGMSLSHRKRTGKDTSLRKPIRAKSDLRKPSETVWE